MPQPTGSSSPRRRTLYRFASVGGTAALVGSIALLAAFAFAGTAYAANGLFDHPPESDWAIGWLEILFRGGVAAEDGANSLVRLAPLTTALRQALSVYSLGMLVIAGILVLYHVTAMVAETAHDGTAMGRRTNQLWAPIRLVVAIGLLVPIGGGLNSGQYLIVKLAESGSSLASNAWRGIVETMKDSLSGPVAPRAPDVARLVAVATEIELCRNMYHQMFSAVPADSQVRLIGDMTDNRRIPPQRLTPEIWRTTNALHADAALCGEYRFLSRDGGAADTSGNGAFERLAADWADFARADAERLIVQARAIADPLSPAFTYAATLANPQPIPLDARSRLAAIVKEQQAALDAKRRAMMANSVGTVNQTLDESARAGWIAAGSFLTDLTRQQALYGDLTAQALPSVQAPLFGHKVMSRAALTEAIDNNPTLRTAPDLQRERIHIIYDQMTNGMKQVRGWLYGQQMADATLMMTDQFDLRDALGDTSDSETGFFLFARQLNAASLAFGVWAEAPRDLEAASPSDSFARDFAGAMISNPIAALAEIGRRYLALGTWLFGMTGPGLAEPGTMTSAALFAVIGLGFSVCGLALLFLLPLLPFFRLFLAVVAWLLEAFEAVVALPLVALAHLNPTGEGLSGPVARQAYWLWLRLFMRPILTLFGFVIGLALFMLAISFLNVMFLHLTAPLTAAHGGTVLGVRTALALLYAVLAYAATNAAFKGINLLPDRTLHWLSLQSATPSHTAAPQTRPNGAAATTALNVAGGGRMIGSSAYATGGDGRGSSRTGSTETDTQNPHKLKSALFPALHEAPPEPVVIAPQAAAQAVAQTNATGPGGSAGSASAAASGPGATATASAHASALAQQVPADRSLHPDIVRTAANLAMLVEHQKDTKARETALRKDNPTSPAPKTETKPNDSREQSAATPDDAKTE